MTRYFRTPHSAIPAEWVVSSVAIEEVGAHDRIRVWSRGALAGELVLQRGDGEVFATLALKLEEEDRT